jgi:uncharacterized OB-fold protein
MNEQAITCKQCGAVSSRKAKFCPKCGTPLTPSPAGQAGTWEKISGAVDTISSTVPGVRSTVSSAASLAKTAESLAGIPASPPAEWKVVVGEVLPAAGQRAVEAAVEAGVTAAGRKVAGEAGRAVTRHAGGGWESVPRQAELPARPVCPSCGKTVLPGAKFCGSCGAKIAGDTKTSPAPSSRPVCPSCGQPVSPGAKFCGSCGHRLS